VGGENDGGGIDSSGQAASAGFVATGFNEMWM
jgi:hypothetical protein